jgi:hypothetical protein
MSKVDFTLAAEAAADPVEAESIVFGFGPYGSITVRVPDTAQVLLLQSKIDDPRKAAPAMFRFLERLMSAEDYELLTDLIERGIVSQDLLMGGDDANDAGILDSLIEAAGARPTQPSGDSSPSSSSGGPRSTGRSPGKGSIQSGSLSAVS